MNANPPMYADVKISIEGKDRIIAGRDIPMIQYGQPRPLRDAKREPVWKDCVLTEGSDIVFLVKMKEVRRIPKPDFFRMAAV